MASTPARPQPAVSRMPPIAVNIVLRLPSASQDQAYQGRRGERNAQVVAFPSTARCRLEWPQAGYFCHSRGGEATFVIPCGCICSAHALTQELGSGSSWSVCNPGPDQHPYFSRYRSIKSMEHAVPAGAPAHPAHSRLELAAAQPRVARALDQPRRGRRAQERRRHRGPGLPPSCPGAPPAPATPSLKSRCAACCQAWPGKDLCLLASRYIASSASLKAEMSSVKGGIAPVAPTANMYI